MDLSNLVNPTNSAPEPKHSQSSSPVAQRQSQSHAFPPPPGANGPPPSYPQYNSQRTTPQYAPPPQEHRSPSGSLAFQGNGATPLQTPSHHGPGHYPFPQNPSQSPVATHQGQQYSSYSANPSSGPGSRPVSHGYSQQPHAPSQLTQSGVPPGFQQYSSHSPTSPSQPGHTPHSVRQSPLATFAPPPQPQQAQQYHYQHSQPSTPLGPPSLQYQRTTGHGSHAEFFSPNHQRHFSGASNGMIAGSPAQHHPSVGNLIDSPSAYNRQSPQMRRTSDYLSQGERDRSLSVSPKTRIVPRLPSHGSRQSSLNDAYGTRSSIHSNGPPPQEAQSHVQSPVSGRHMGVAQPSFAHSASDVSQMASRSSQPSHPDAPNQPAPQTPLFINSAPPQHHNHKMGMDNLLTPAREQQEQDHHDMMARDRSSDPFAAPPKAHAQSPEKHIKHEQGSHTLLQQPVQPAAAFPQPTNSLKREAEDRLASEPPMKREKHEKKRRYSQRPIWAALAKGNPKFDGTNGNNGQTVKPHRQQQQQQRPQQPPNNHHQQQQQQQQPRATPQPQPMPQPRQQPNGSAHSNGAPVDPFKPWLQPEPLDMDLIHARSVLGSWEKTFKWITPMPDLLQEVQDWLWQQLERHSDIGNDPRTGVIEIEAKIGTLIRSGEHDRHRGEYRNTVVIDPNFNKQYRFESRMEEPEHQAMNKFLNATTQESLAPGRVHMAYEHLYQTDTFATLSPAGIASLPASVQKRQSHGRELRLRTSRSTKDNNIVLAQVVKVPLGDLHIHSPRSPYDCRISMNLEVNFPPEMDVSDLVEPPSHDRPPPPERKKDRLSYKHLAYSVDLTKVETYGSPSKYELELEVDANVLREQIERAKRRQQSAYADVVSGFLDNAVFLMRTAP